MTSSKPELRIAIIGAGIVGVTLAHAFLERSIPVQIYEATNTIRTTGGGINATEAGVRALKLCGKHCYEAFKAVSTTHNRARPELFWNVTEEGNKVLAEVVSRNEYGSMNRIKFLEALASRLPGDVVNFDSKIKSIREANDHLVLEFENGSAETVDVILGCDGLHSQVRSHVAGSEYGPSFSHSIICRGPLPAEGVEAIVGEEIGRGSQVGIGSGDGIVLYPVDPTTVNFGYYYHEPNEWPYWPQVVHRMTKAELIAKMQAKQPPPDPKHMALVNLCENEITQWGIWHQARDLPTYSKGTVAILGDAAHASGPYLSTGAGMGYEDAVVCAELLQAVIRKDLDVQARRAAIQATLEIYSDVRRERSQFMVHSTAEAGKILMGFRPDPLQGAEEYAKRNAFVWNYNIQDAVDLALERLNAIWNGG